MKKIYVYRTKFAEHRKRYDFLRQIICQELTDLQTVSLIRAALDSTLEANALIALLDGISTLRCYLPFLSSQQNMVTDPA